jgi:hypothetical protein
MTWITIRGGGNASSTGVVRRGRLGAALAVVVCLASAAGAHASYGGAISNEQTKTYWAYSATPGPVRARPTETARKTDRLRMWTEVHYPQVYLVLSERVDRHRTWFEVRLPDRPNGRTGWVSERELSVLHVVNTHLVVDERHLRMALYRRGHRIFSARIGVGKPSTPTPTGHFWITEKFRAQGGLYGPYAFGTSDNSVLTDWPGGGVIGIHGTNEPSLIPGRPSHGCIRLLNAEDVKLWGLLPVGTPITIR